MSIFNGLMKNFSGLNFKVKFLQYNKNLCLHEFCFKVLVI